MRFKTLLCTCLSIILVSGTLLLTSGANPAYGSLSGEGETGRESLYLSAPLVFSGVAGNSTPDGTLFEVTKMYKSPWPQFPPKGRVYLNKQSKYVLDSEAPVFKTGKEYLIFAFKPKAKDSIYSAQTGLGAYNTTVDENLKTLREENKTTEAAFVFVGKLERLSRLQGRRTATPDSILQLDAVEIFKTASPEKFKKGASYSIAANFCGEKFEVGQKYLVFANRFFDRRSHARQAEIPADFGSVEFYAQCDRIYPLHEKEILKNFGKVQQKGNQQ